MSPPFYAESPFERIVDVHWKKPPDGGGPPPDGGGPTYCCCYPSWDSGNPFGQGSPPHGWNGPLSYFYIEGCITWINQIANPMLEAYFNYPAWFAQWPMDPVPPLYPGVVADTSCPGQYPPLWVWEDGTNFNPEGGYGANFPNGFMLNGGIGSTLDMVIYGSDAGDPSWAGWNDCCVSDLLAGSGASEIAYPIFPDFRVASPAISVTVEADGTTPHTYDIYPGTTWYCTKTYSPVNVLLGGGGGVTIRHYCDGKSSLKPNICLAEAPPVRGRRAFSLTPEQALAGWNGRHPGARFKPPS
jgi:hypothetical protein